jgi:hypothetical protein
MDNCNSAYELSKTLLELLTIVVRGCVLDLLTDLRNASLDISICSLTIDDGCVVLINNDALSLTKVCKRNVLKLKAKILSDALTTGEDSDI